ncbi:hypothetical protein QP113_02650 [Lactobacillus mulieris]|nr:hypothetical protein [Lactobacillus mulieris]MCW8072801.1 hypothetical protein [Lactobacillus mulieris]MDK6268399.1 hypothetical protein [Lactobacillus mulieris]
MVGICDYCGTLILDASFKVPAYENKGGKYDNLNFCSNKCLENFIKEKL